MMESKAVEMRKSLNCLAKYLGAGVEASALQRGRIYMIDETGLRVDEHLSEQLASYFGGHETPIGKRTLFGMD